MAMIQAYLQSIEQRVMGFVETGEPCSCDAALLSRSLILSAFDSLCKAAIHAAAQQPPASDDSNNGNSTTVLLMEFFTWIKDKLLPLYVLFVEKEHKLLLDAAVDGNPKGKKNSSKKQNKSNTREEANELTQEQREFMREEKKLIQSLISLAITSVTECNSCGLCKNNEELTTVASEIIALSLEHANFDSESPLLVIKFAFKLLLSTPAGATKKSSDGEDYKTRLRSHFSLSLTFLFLSTDNNNSHNTTIAIELMKMLFEKVSNQAIAKQLQVLKTTTLPCVYRALLMMNELNRETRGCRTHFEPRCVNSSL